MKTLGGVSVRSATLAATRWSSLALLFGMAGCGVMPKLPINPSPLHANSDVKVPGGADKETINIYSLPQDRYLQAFVDADRAGKAVTPEQLKSFADAGIAVVQVQCLRWFNTLANSQLSKDFQDANYNVIRQLGTALLGIGGAAPAFVAVYGAGNTAYEGVSNNVESSFLGAPNGKKVKQKVMQLLDEQELALRTEAGNTGASVLGIYRRLERYADICTHTMAREIVSSSLDQAKVSLSTDGSLEVQPAAGVKELAEARATKQAVLLEQKKREDLLTERAAKAEKARDEAQSAARVAEQKVRALAEQLQQANNSKAPAAVAPAQPASGI